MNLELILTSVLSLILGMAIGGVIFLIKRKIAVANKKDEAQKEIDRIIHRAKSQAAKVQRESQQKAKDFESRARRNVENEIRKEKQKITNTENQLKSQLVKLENDFKAKNTEVEMRGNDLKEEEERLKIADARILKLEGTTKSQLEEVQKKLENVSNYSSEQAKQELLDVMREEAEKEALSKVMEIENQVKSESKNRVMRLIATAISRFAGEVAAERTVCSIAISGEEMKGKIIGREGRNIKALEAACGVDVVIDETPDSVVISSFDPARRHVAKEAIERLIEDGRIHPARIEEVVAKVKEDMIDDLKEEGEKACFDLGVHNVDSEILGILGELKFRQIETQNMLQHSIEVAYIAGLIAAEIQYDVQLARRAGLLHDIGHAIYHTVEGNHAKAGADFAKKHGESKAVCEAISLHEEADEAPSLLCHMVQAANNLSKARPGSRRSMMENFIKRLENLESIGNSFDGVERTYAVQAGKEIRVLVDSGKVTDDQTQMLSRDIAKKIKKELSYPGQIKVAVIRETRMVEHAR